MLLAEGRIYSFPKRREPENRFTIRDKLDLHASGERIVGAGLACVIGRETGGGPHYDFVQLVRPLEAGIAWTFVRSGPAIRVWQGSHGDDLGRFPTLAEAMEAALTAKPNRRPGPFRRLRRASAAGH